MNTTTVLQTKYIALHFNIAVIDDGRQYIEAHLKNLFYCIYFFAVKTSIVVDNHSMIII